MKAKDPIWTLRSLCDTQWDPWPASRDHVNELLDEIEAAYIKLPTDVDGVPIRPGDDVQLTDGRTADAHCVTFFEDTVDVGSCGWHPIWLRHANTETVESILGEAIQFGHQANTGTRLEDVIADYAERIRKAVDGTDGKLWVSETEYNALVDERDKWRSECQRMGEKIDRLRNDRGMA